MTIITMSVWMHDDGYEDDGAIHKLADACKALVWTSHVKVWASKKSFDAFSP